MTSIGILGAGVSGLHLALLLRNNGVDVTIYTDRSSEEIAAGRLQNTVALFYPTLERERSLGIAHWDPAEYGYIGHRIYVAGPEPLIFRGEFAQRCRAVDLRMYQSCLLDDAAEAGARVEVGPASPQSLLGASERHDLMVVAAGRGPLADVFPPTPERRGAEPLRRITAVLVQGIAPPDPADVVISAAPGVGEIIVIPFLTFGGSAHAVLIEGVPGGELAALADRPYGDDPQGFTEGLLGVLKVHAPLVYERISPADFAVTRPDDVLQGAVRPCLREDWARLPNGRLALAVGDAHCTVDPIVAQGANSASYSAFVVGEAILEDQGLDEAFCNRVADRRAEYMHAVYDWVESSLTPPSPQRLALLLAQAVNRTVADEQTDNFAHPVRQWATAATWEQTSDYLAGHGLDAKELLAALR